MNTLLAAIVVPLGFVFLFFLSLLWALGGTWHPWRLIPAALSGTAFLVASCSPVQAATPTRIDVLAYVDMDANVWGDEQVARFAIEEAFRQASVNVGGQLGMELTVDFVYSTDTVVALDDFGGWRGLAAPHWGYTGEPDLIAAFTNRKTPEPDGPYSVMTDGSVCGSRVPVIVQEIQNDALDGLTLAHAIGHVFGAEHDAQRGYQMSTYARESDYFSPASIAAVAAHDKRCLVDQPVQAAASVPAGTSGGGGAFEWWSVTALFVLLLLQTYRAHCWRRRAKQYDKTAQMFLAVADERKKLLEQALFDARDLGAMMAIYQARAYKAERNEGRTSESHSS